MIEVKTEIKKVSKILLFREKIKQTHLKSLSY